MSGSNSDVTLENNLSIYGHLWAPVGFDAAFNCERAELKSWGEFFTIIMTFYFVVFVFK